MREKSVTTRSARPAPQREQGMTLSRAGVLSGKARVDEASAPPDLDALFPSVTLDELAASMRAKAA